MALTNLLLRVTFAGIDRLSGLLDGISGRTRRAAENLRDTNTALRRHKAELRDVQRQIAAGTGDAAELARRERELTREIERGNRELADRRRALERAQAAQERFQRTQARADRLMGAGRGAIMGGVALGAGVAVGAKQAMDLEEALAGVKKVTNMTAPQLAQMSSDFLDMSTRIPMAAEGLANIAAAAGSAGIGMDKSGKAMRDQRAQLIAFTEDAATMGIAFDMTAEDAGATMAKWRTAFMMAQPGVRALGDQVNALTNTFGGKAVDVADILTRIGPLGKVAGLAAPQIAALGSTLNSIGVENEIAATGIKNTMLALTKGSAATKSQSEAFKELGLNSEKVAADMQRDAAGTIVDVLERIGNLKPEKQASMLTNLFGSESVGAIAPMLTNLDGLKTRLRLVGDTAKYTGSMQGEFLSRIATSKGATGLAWNALQALNIELGQQLLPTVVWGATAVRNIATSMRGWAKEHPALASGLTHIVALGATMLVSFGGIAVGAGAMMKAWGYIRAGAFMLAGPLRMLMGPLRMLPTLFTVVRIAVGLLARGVMSAGLTMLANPLVLGIVLIGAALVGLGYLVYRNWDKIKAAFFSALNWMKGLLPSFKNIGSMIMEGLLSMLSPARLFGHFTRLGLGAIAAFKKVLGIHSPSRVFAALGGHVAGGLAQGIDRGSSAPVQRTRRLAGQLVSAMAIGAGVGGATPAVAGAGGGAAGAMTVTINVYQQPGEDSRAFADRVVAVLEARGRDRRNSSYSDA